MRADALHRPRRHSDLECAADTPSLSERFTWLVTEATSGSFHPLFNVVDVTTPLFTQFAPAIRMFAGDASSPDLLLASGGPLEVYYAPFDHMNPDARVVLVGITPGRTQAVNALREARTRLERGDSPSEALHGAKRAGAFSGAMRANLTAMLDHIGLAKWLGLSSCEALFGEAAGLLQSTSVLQFPVFLNSKNYSAKPDIVGTPLLRSLMLRHFTPLASALPNAVFLPLGPVPSKALAWLVTQGHMPSSRVLNGLPHPSGANVERIQYFLGRKEASNLSAKTNARKLDAAHAQLVLAVAALG